MYKGDCNVTQLNTVVIMLKFHAQDFVYIPTIPSIVQCTTVSLVQISQLAPTNEQISQ